MKNRKQQSGFTLIELLVVIAIIAILSVVVVLTLNPAELLRQARDSNRISDMATLKSAVSLYLADVSSPNLGTSSVLDVSGNTSTATSSYNLTGNYGYSLWAQTVQTSTLRGISTGTGWVPVNFSAISSGAPIGNEPIDPLNSGNDFYTFLSSSTVFKMATRMESSKYGNGGASDVVSTDGGASATAFETGTSLTL